uniref:Uncharacterized protein n=1 Tax=Anopheles coluzzii TaxID=1518534 RepID=A0A8W7PSA0_ANOCL
MKPGKVVIDDGGRFRRHGRHQLCGAGGARAAGCRRLEAAEPHPPIVVLQAIDHDDLGAARIDHVRGGGVARRHVHGGAGRRRNRARYRRGHGGGGSGGGEASSDRVWLTARPNRQLGHFGRRARVDRGVRLHVVSHAAGTIPGQSGDREGRLRDTLHAAGRWQQFGGGSSDRRRRLRLVLHHPGEGGQLGALDRALPATDRRRPFVLRRGGSAAGRRKVAGWFRAQATAAHQRRGAPVGRVQKRNRTVQDGGLLVQPVGSSLNVGFFFCSGLASRASGRVGVYGGPPVPSANLGVPVSETGVAAACGEEVATGTFFRQGGVFSSTALALAAPAAAVVVVMVVVVLLMLAMLLLAGLQSDSACSRFIRPSGARCRCEHNTCRFFGAIVWFGIYKTTQSGDG